MIKFSIILGISIDPIIKNLEEIIDNSTSYDQFVFDITVSSKSVPKFERTKNGGYKVAYTRPLFLNFMKTNAFDLQYDFHIISSNPTTIDGKIRVKPFVLYFLLFFLCICGVTFFYSYPGDDMLSWLFYLLIPVILPIHFFRQIKKFKRELVAIFNTLEKKAYHLK